MPKTPRLKGREIIATLRKAGFEVVRSKGSHHFLRHPDGRTTVIPVHAGELVGVGLFLKILRDVDMNVSRFEEFL
jgi:predicted RNA binding protein YcfA (HicA-like mRNA interferase family)